MKATTLSISVASMCNKSCPYCVSKMTNSVTPNWPIFVKNLNKVLEFSKSAGITSVIFTGKGEPFLNPGENMSLQLCADKFKDFPIEVQTNGLVISKHPEILPKLYPSINTVAISIDNPKILFSDWLVNYSKIAKANGINTRYTINLSDAFYGLSFRMILGNIKEQGIADQFSFRNITAPSSVKAGGESFKKWIEDNNCLITYTNMIADFKNCDMNKKKVRSLPYGAILYDIEGIGFTYFDFCIQEESGEDDIRSLIYQEDGHLYTSWDSCSASRIF